MNEENNDMKYRPKQPSNEDSDMKYRPKPDNGNTEITQQANMTYSANPTPVPATPEMTPVQPMYNNQTYDNQAYNNQVYGNQTYSNQGQQNMYGQVNGAVNNNGQAPKNNNNFIILIAILLLIIVGLGTFVGIKYLGGNETKEVEKDKKSSSSNKDKEDKDSDKDKDDDKNDDEDDDQNEDNDKDDNKDEDKDKDDDTGNGGSRKAHSWNDFDLIINGVEVTLPITYKELVELTGATLKDTEIGTKLEANYYKSVLLYKDGNYVLNSEIINDTTNPIKLEDGKVSEIGQSEYLAEIDSSIKIVFPGNLEVGMDMTKDKLTGLFGKIDKEYVSDDKDFAYEKYEYNSDDIYNYYNNYEITIIDGKISDLTLNHRGD